MPSESECVKLTCGGFFIILGASMMLASSSASLCFQSLFKIEEIEDWCSEKFWDCWFFTKITNMAFSALFFNGVDRFINGVKIIFSILRFPEEIVVIIANGNEDAAEGNQLNGDGDNEVDGNVAVHNN